MNGAEFVLFRCSRRNLDDSQVFYNVKKDNKDSPNLYAIKYKDSFLFFYQRYGTQN